MGAARFRLTSPSTLKLNEADIARQCTDYLRVRKWWPERLPVGRFRTMRDTWVTFGSSGIPDYIAIHAKYPAFFMETKGTGRKLRPIQVARFRQIQLDYGLSAVMVDSLDELISWLNAYEARHA